MFSSSHIALVNINADRIAEVSTANLLELIAVQNNLLKMVQHIFHEPAIQQWLLANGSREEIIEWLVWNDGNGIYTDGDSEAEDYPPLTLETARASMRRVLEQQ